MGLTKEVLHSSQASDTPHVIQLIVGLWPGRGLCYISGKGNPFLSLVKLQPIPLGSCSCVRLISEFIRSRKIERMSVQLPVPAGHFGGGKVTHGGLPGKVTTQHVLPGQSVTQTDTGILIAKNASATVTEVPVSLDDADDLVITPGGARHSSLVHHIPPGTTLDVTDMRLRHIGADGKLIADFGVLNRRRGEEPLMPNNVNRVGRGDPKPTSA